jgi:hypothetical protein
MAARDSKRDKGPSNPAQTIAVVQPEAQRVINLRDLPLEVLLIILEKLRDSDPVTLLGAVPGVSRHFRAVCALVQGELKLRLDHFATYGEKFSERALYDVQVGALESATKLFPRITLSAPDLHPLHIACEVGSFKMAQKLLKSDDGILEIDKVVGERDTPLILACYGGYAEIVRLLIEKGADVDKAEELLGNTPLVVACLTNNLDIARLLLEKGADINKVDLYGRTPLRDACSGRRLGVAAFLLEKGADINQADAYDRTPLFAACDGGYVEIVRLLIEKGADLNKANRAGTTPLAIALKKNRAGVVVLLRAAGANE